MTTKDNPTIRRSVGQQEPSLNKAVNPMLVYDFALRCAIRAWLEHTGKSAPAKKERNERQSTHITRSDMFGSLVERFRDENKPDKLTREVVRALLRRLDDIKKGRDSTEDEYQDELFIRIVSLVKKYVQQHRYRPTGSVNDLVIHIVRTSESQLKESKSNPDAWNEALARYTARFAEIIIIVLREDAPTSATPELMEMLESFIVQKPTRQRSSRLYPPGSPSPSSFVETLETFSMVKTVEHLFQLDEKEHYRRLVKLQAVCTVSSLLVDLKKCIDNVHTLQPFPGRPEDFPSQLAYVNWRDRETKQLSAFIRTLQLMHPDISLSGTCEADVSGSNLQSRGGTPKRRSLSYISEMYGHSPVSKFTFIPNDPHAYFRLLMNMCIDYDTKVIPGSERVKSSVLSHQSDELLRECWKTWRLSTSFRAVLYLELITERFKKDDLTTEDISFATQNLEKEIKENEISNWTSYDSNRLYQVFEDLDNALHQALNDALSEYWKMRPEWAENLVSLLSRIRSSPVNPKNDCQLVASDDFQKIVERAAVNRWSMLRESAKIESGDELQNLLAIADSLKKELVSLTKRQLNLKMDSILSIPSIVMERQMPYFALEMENWAYLPENQETLIDTIFELYHKVLSLKRLYIQYGPRQKSALLKVEYWFLSYVRQWLKKTESNTQEWVENAVKQDKFVRINNSVLHSSSIVDLFSMFHQAVDFVQNLQWPNELQLCKFMTVLSKIIGIALERYTDIIEDLIKNDIYQYDFQATDKGSTTLLEKARNQFTSGRLQASTKSSCIHADFVPTLCVRINNVEAARARLDRLYQAMDVDEVAEIMRENGRTVEKVEQTNFLYSIKIVRAENLQPLDHNGLSDPYVVLEIDNKQITRTRTCYETLNPRWDQVFDIWLSEKTVDVLAVVYDEDLIGANEECGGVWFKLSPEYFDDYQTHELTLNLHPQGKLILRVSMEGEKDDIQFWFGKAFRTLKRAEHDAAGLIADKMSRYMGQYLSRKTLDTLLCRDRSLFSFNRASKHIELSLQDCEDSIAPLLDYLERNLKILNDNLSEANMQFVVLKIWREILLALECVLLPPLSEHLSDTKPLDDYEFHVVFKWLELLKVLFNGGEDGDAVPIEKLENTHYYALLAVNASYNLETDELMETYNTVLKNQMDLKMRGGRKADRSRSVYQSKNTARRKKFQRRSISIDLPSSEAILRILRMRNGKHVREFLHKEFEKRNNPSPPPPPPHIVSPATLGVSMPITLDCSTTPVSEHTLPI